MQPGQRLLSYSHKSLFEASLSVSPKVQFNSTALVAARVAVMGTASYIWLVFLGWIQWAVLKTVLTIAVS